MTWLTTASIIGVVAVIMLFWFYRRNISEDHMKEVMEKRQKSAKLVSRADHVEGMQHIPVAIALSESVFYYENPDLEAQIELSRVDEVEYSNELSTGTDVPEHSKVLRLRSHGQAFEFILDAPSASKWATQLPSHRMDEPKPRPVHQA